MCQPVLNCAKGIENSGQRFPEQMFPTPPGGVLGLGVVCPKTDVPHGVKRVGFRQMVWYQCSIGFASWAGYVCIVLTYQQGQHFPANATLATAVEVMHASTKALVLAWVWRGHNPLRCAVVLKAVSAIIYCSPQEYDISSATKDVGDNCDK